LAGIVRQQTGTGGVVYGGAERQKRTSGNVVGWKHIEEIFA